MKRSFVWGVFLVLLIPFASRGQALQVPHYGEGEGETLQNYPTTRLESGEIVPWFPIKDVVVTARRTFKTEEDRLNYLRLERNVLRVLPYAIYAQKRYEQLDRDIALASSSREEKR